MTDSLQDIDQKSDLDSFQWACKIARLLISDRVRESYMLVEGVTTTYSKYPFLFEEESQDYQAGKENPERITYSLYQKIPKRNMGFKIISWLLCAGRRMANHQTFKDYSYS
jgi:hypothetical protein